MPKTPIAILTGGTSSERKIALRSSTFLKRLLDDRYRITVFDLPRQLPTFLAKRKHFALAIPVFHGVGGEDGTIQGFLKTLGLPFLFSDVTTHAIALNKAFTKTLIANLGIKTAHAITVSKQEMKTTVFKKPCVIKPLDGGSSIGVVLAKSKEEFTRGLQDVLRTSEQALVEDYLEGEEFTVAVIEDRGTVKALPVIEIRSKHMFFDYESKYDAALVEEICPAPTPKQLSDKLQAIAISAHQLLGARHLTRTDIIVDKRGTPWFLEINTIPGLTSTSLTPKAMQAGGYDVADLFTTWISQTLGK